MPTEQELAESFDVSRITAKRAMDELAGEGLVERRRGRGSHVIYEYTPQPVQAPLIGMLQEIESMARHSEVQVLSCRRSRPPEPVAGTLGLTAGEDALFLTRVRSRDRQPFGHYASWTVGLSGVKKSDFRRTPRLEIFRQQGIILTHVTQTISAEAATAELAERLDTRIGAPLISLLRHSYVREKGGERVVDVLHAHYHPERFQYQMDLRLDGGG
jgi:GntR family transcriptional regulator